MLMMDLTKTALPQLFEFDPDWIIVDFIDERFSMMEVGASLVTMSDELRRSGLQDLPPFSEGRQIGRLSRECDQLWAGAMRRLGHMLPHKLPRAKMVLHRAGWAGRALHQGHVRRYKEERLQTAHRANTLLARYNAHFLRAFPTAHVINASQPNRMADSGNKWRLKPYHYVPGYYVDIMRELERAMAQDPAAGPYHSPIYREAG
jgi:hypothetical protein